jgi:predicted RNase H-like HicB family nuclease
MKRKKITVVLEKGKDDFGAWAENIPGIYGAGNTSAEAKSSVEEAIAIYIKENSKLPAVLKGDFEIIYKMDTVSLLNYYKGIFTKSGLEKITGINQKQLQHYSTGHRKPRQTQAKKIESALHNLGKELLSVQM